MSRSRAVRSGFSALFERPALYFGEAMWRSVFLITAWSLGLFAIAQVLQSLPVTDMDAFGLSGILPPLFPMAVRHIFTGSGTLLFQTLATLIIAIASLWWAASSLGRVVLLPAMLGRTGAAQSVIGLQFLRAIFAAAAMLAYVGLLIFAMRMAGSLRETWIIWAVLLSAVFSIVWSTVSWYLTLAPILAVDEGLSVLASFRASAVLARTAASQFTWIAFVFWMLRLVLTGFALSLYFSLAAVAAELAPIAMFIALVLAVIVYALFSFLLHAARLAAYVRVVAWSRAESLGA